MVLWFYNKKGSKAASSLSLSLSGVALRCVQRGRVNVGVIWRHRFDRFEFTFRVGVEYDMNLDFTRR